MKLYVLMLIAVAVVAVVPGAAGQLSPKQCNDQKNNLVNRCRNVVLPGGKPSAACCQLIRAADLECACKFVSPKLVAALGGAQRATALIQGCGRTVPRNFKCGSVTTPP